MDYQKALKSYLFFLLNPAPFNEQSYQKQKGLVSSQSSPDYEIGSEKFLYWLYIFWPSLLT